ncbi:MAG: Flp1 family type IVb pilin [Bdellovibrionota bacterium]
MKKLTKKNRRLFSNEKGQGMVEYILLLVVVIGLVAIFKGRIIEVIKGKTDQVGSGMDSFQVEQ